MTFEVGKYYRTHKGTPALCVHKHEDGAILFASEGPTETWRTNCHGQYWNDEGQSFEMGGKWQEPAKVIVELYRHNRNGRIQAWTKGTFDLLVADSWTLVARKEITVGEGL